MNANDLSLEEKKILARFHTDFPFFALNCLYTEPKEGGEIVPLSLNKAQWFLFECMMAQLASIGMIRLIVIKGRQQGISTLIDAFLYWLTVINPYFTISIIAHESSATKTLAEKIETFYDNCPSLIRPKETDNNDKNIKWNNKSKCLFFTAGAKNTGRSKTAQGQHQSERGFFENPAEIDAGAGQIVANIPGTYVFKESTGNGMNHLWRETMAALERNGLYRVVFIPWYWTPEYRSPVPEDFEVTEEEYELLELYGDEGLTDYEQLQWRREKIAEFEHTRGNGEKWFKQEYPNSLDEAFQESGEAYIPASAIVRARKSIIEDPGAPIVMGVDPGRTGDRTVITFRQGREITEIIKYKTMDEMRLAGLIGNFIDQRGVDRCFVDYGQGAGCIDRLRERGYGSIVDGVWFGEKPNNYDLWGNKRAEMYGNLYQWLHDGEVSLPDDDDMAADILSMPEPTTNSNGKLYFPKKEDIKKKIGRSPDIADSIVLTYARTVRKAGSGQFGKFTKNTRKGSSLTAMARVRDTNNESHDRQDTSITKAPTTRRYGGR